MDDPPEDDDQQSEEAPEPSGKDEEHSCALRPCRTVLALPPTAGRRPLAGHPSAALLVSPPGMVRTDLPECCYQVFTCASAVQEESRLADVRSVSVNHG